MCQSNVNKNGQRKRRKKRQFTDIVLDCIITNRKEEKFNCKHIHYNFDWANQKEKEEDFFVFSIYFKTKTIDD